MLGVDVLRHRLRLFFHCCTLFDRTPDHITSLLFVIPPCDRFIIGCSHAPFMLLDDYYLSIYIPISVTHYTATPFMYIRT
jgi:hypothetical protein